MRHFIGPAGVACGAGEGDPTLEQAMTWGSVDCPACLYARPQPTLGPAWVDTSFYRDGDNRGAPNKMRLETADGIVVAVHQFGRHDPWRVTARVGLPVLIQEPLKATTLEAAQREALLVVEQVLRDRWQRACSACSE